MRVQPVVVGIYLPEDSVFEFYKEGVFSARNCELPPGAPNASLAMINHAVLVVGFNKDPQLDKPYWIVRPGGGGGGSRRYGPVCMLCPPCRQCCPLLPPAHTASCTFC